MDRSFTIDEISGRVILTGGTFEAASHTLVVRGTEPGGSFGETEVTINFSDLGSCPIDHVSIGTSGASCATSSNGQFWCWGSCHPDTCGYSGAAEITAASLRDADNRIGLAAALQPMPFTPTAAEGKVVEVVGLAGESTAQQTQCLRTELGNVRCWGNADYAPYNNINNNIIATPGDAPVQRSLGPVSAGLANLPAQRTAVALYAGVNHFCAVLDQVVAGRSNLECWGSRTLFESNSAIDSTAGGSPFSLGGEIVDLGGRTVQSTPQAVGLTRHTGCALTTDDEVYCFGRDILDSTQTAGLVQIGEQITSDRLPVMVGASTKTVCVLTLRRSSGNHRVSCYGTIVELNTAFGSSAATPPYPTTSHSGMINDQDTLDILAFRQLRGTPTSFAVV